MVRAATLAVFAFTWIFRWLTIDFTNDHFVHLSRARQILLGELPVRDFFDPGLPLHYFASAAALAVSGQNLLGEAILTITLVALGAALTFYLAARTSRSVPLALVSTIIAVVLFPRLYNYPKVFLYPLALIGVWHYAARRTTGAVVLLGAVTAMATLFRLDHGLYITICVTVALVLANLDQLRAVPPAFVRFAAVLAALVLPFFIFVQLTAGIPTLLEDIQAQRSSVASARVLTIPFSVDRTQPVIVFDPPPPSKVSWLQRARSRFPVLRMQFAPGVLNAANAMAWLYYTTVLIPVVALVVLVVRWRRGALEPVERTTIGTAIVMCLVIHQTLMRGSPDSRLPDVAGPTFVLAAWIAGAIRPRQVVGKRGFRGQASAPASPRWKSVAVRTVVSVLCVGTLWAATTFGETGERISATGILAGPAATAERFRQVSAWMQMRPIDYYAPPGSTGVRALTRYVLECTRPGDRILAGSFEPQIFFYAERAFAGGQEYLKGGWHESRGAQELTIARMQRQRVPIVLINVTTEAEVQGFSLIYQYVRDNYREAARSNFGSGPDYAVLVKNDVPARGTYPSLDLPCYR
jgi:hypothetical protein